MDRGYSLFRYPFPSGRSLTSVPVPPEMISPLSRITETEVLCRLSRSSWWSDRATRLGRLWGQRQAREWQADGGDALELEARRAK